tara:strand:- start:106 stop:519 length:414 start_codon:yes stop_codon:yes gene_type:complete
MKPITIIWIIFTILFSYLSYYHYEQSKFKYSEFKVTPLDRGKVRIGITPINKPLKDFAKDFNKYLQKQNNLNEKQNKFSAIGYLIASLTALLSFVLSFEYGKNHANKKYNLNPYYYLKNGIARLWKLIKKDNSSETN